MWMDDRGDKTKDRAARARERVARTRICVWASNAHVFFWLLVLGLVPAVIVAWRVDPKTPSWALESEAVYRLEVGAAVFLGAYFLALVLCLGYLGKSLGRLGFPGGGEVETKDPALEEASEGATDFQEEARQNFQELADVLDTLSTQVTALEDRKLGERLAALEDRSLGERVADLEAKRLDEQPKGLEDGG